MKKTFCIYFLYLIFQSNIYSYTSSEVFEKHLNRVFIESGSYRGDGIKNALSAGFEEIHFVELAPHLYEYCTKLYENNPAVHIYYGDSSEVFNQILKTINEPVTFWLDGHYSWGDTAKGQSNTPLLNELDIISRHDIKTHKILIDDVRQFGQIEFDFLTKRSHY